MMGAKAETMDSVPAGNTVALVGIDSFIAKSATLSDHVEAHTIKAMKFTVSPFVRIAVSVKNALDLPKLVEGLKKLSKADPLVKCTQEENGEHIVACAGELHAEVSIRDLRKEYAKVEIQTKEPQV